MRPLTRSRRSHHLPRQGGASRACRLLSLALTGALLCPPAALATTLTKDLREATPDPATIGSALGSGFSAVFDVFLRGEALVKRAGAARVTPKPADRANRPSAFVISKEARAGAGKTSSGKAGVPHPRSATLLAQSQPPFGGELLPEEEQGSVFSPQNQIGSPPGQRGSAASTPPAATAGTEMPGSANFAFAVPVVDLPGRGLHVSLSLAYNSRLWNKSVTFQGQTRMSYNVDGSWPAPGFTLGLGKITLRSQPSGDYYVLTAPDGTRRDLQPNSSTGRYVSTDGTFISFDPATATATYGDGTRVRYGATGQYPVRVTDRNGNYFEVFYRAGGGPQIDYIKDTLGRVVRFGYDAATGDLVTVEAPGYGGAATPRQTIRLYYESVSVNPAGSFASGVLTNNVTSARVIRYAYFPGTQTGYRYDYSAAYGMIYRVVQFRAMQVSTSANNAAGAVTSVGQQAASTTYNYPTSPAGLSDAPTYTRRSDDWAGRTTSMTEGATQVPPFYVFAVDQGEGIETITAPDGTVTETRKVVNPGQWDDGLVTSVEVRKGGVMLQRVQTDWETWELGPYNRRVREVRVTNNNNQTATTTYFYWDAGAAGFNNVKYVVEKGFGGEELRVTKVTYETGAAYESRGLLYLPSSVAVYQNRAGAEADTQRASLTEYGYDESPLTTCPGITMLDPAHSGVTARGNVTTVTAYADAAARGGAVTHAAAYDVAGNNLSRTVDCCRRKEFVYGPEYNYAYQTAVKSGDDGQLVTGATYDRNTGLTRSVTDENARVTAFDYYPASLRLKKLTRRDGGYTSLEYHDALADDLAEPDATPRHSYVKTTTAVDQSGGVFREVSRWQYMDGRGALARTFAQTPDGYVTADVEYDVMGRPYRVNNPYYSAEPAAAPVNQSTWMTSEFDGLGRVKKIVTADANAVLLDYAGTAVTLTDQSGRKRRQVADALGRVERVDEPDAAGNLDTPGVTPAQPAQPTRYKYDLLDNLTLVEQGVQKRSFLYDSLGRLTRQKQPEATAVFNDAGAYLASPHTGAKWSHVFVYDEHGNLSDGYDARNVHAHYDYADALGRLKEITYSDGTPKVRYTYDEARAGYFNAGRLTKVETVLANGTVQTAQSYDHDQMGRVVEHEQKVGAATYAMSYGYNLAGLLVREQYPSGRAVEQSYDAAARLSATRDDAAGGPTYVSAMAYGAHGSPTSVALGNGVTESLAYDPKRLQLTEIKLSKGALPADVIERLVYRYGQVDPATGVVDATKNTNRVAVVENSIGGQLQWQQRLVYDQLGRLKQVSEHPGNNLPGLTFKMAYDYDRYGNRLMAPSQAQALAYTPVTSADISAQTNRFTTGVGYDAAGNVKDDNKFRHLLYSYDANGRQKSVSNRDGSGATQAVMDGLGQRVQTTSAGETRHFVYDVFKRLVAEYTNQPLPGAGGRAFVSSDAQGSTRVVTGANGAVLERRDFDPFGVEIGAGVGLRSAAQGYGGAEAARQGYAGMEREGAGLAHTPWRKYEPASGRWTSPDPYGGSLRPGNPQSLNRYAYVLNDPVNYVDPTGLDVRTPWADDYFIPASEQGWGQIMAGPLAFLESILQVVTYDGEFFSIVENTSITPGQDQGRKLTIPFRTPRQAKKYDDCISPHVDALNTALEDLGFKKQDNNATENREAVGGGILAGVAAVIGLATAKVGVGVIILLTVAAFSGGAGTTKWYRDGINDIEENGAERDAFRAFERAEKECNSKFPHDTTTDIDDPLGELRDAFRVTPPGALPSLRP